MAATTLTRTRMPNTTRKWVGWLIAGVALVCAATVSMFGEKTAELLASLTVVLPGAHAEDNAPIATGRLIEVKNNGNGLALDLDAISAGNLSGTRELGKRIGGGSFDQSGLIVDAP